jgi:hypothetical protein
VSAASPRETNLGIDVYDCHAGGDRPSKIGIGGIRAAVQCHENLGSFLDGSGPLDIQMLPGIAGQHTLQDTVHVSNERSQRIDRGLLQELYRFIRCRQRATRRAVVNPRAAADIADLSFRQDIRAQRFESEEKSHTTQSKPAFAAYSAPDNEWVWSALRNIGGPPRSRRLLTTATSCWSPQLPGGLNGAVQRDQIRFIKMADRDTASDGLLQYFE